MNLNDSYLQIDDLSTQFQETKRHNPNPVNNFQIFRNLSPQYLKGFADTEDNRHYYNNRLLRWTQRQDTNSLYYGAPNGWFKRSQTDALAAGIGDVFLRDTQKDSTLYNNYWRGRERLQQGVSSNVYDTTMYKMTHRANKDILNKQFLTNKFMNPDLPKGWLNKSMIGDIRNTEHFGRKASEIETNFVDPYVRVSCFQNDLLQPNEKLRIAVGMQQYNRNTGTIC